MKKMLMILAVLTTCVVLIGCGGGDKEPTQKPTETVTLDQLAGTEWTLRWWDREEPALLQAEVTLTYVEGQFVGSNGCNNYFNGVEAGMGPGDITVSLGGATRMACPEAESAIETRYMGLLSAVNHMTVTGGELELNYEFEGKKGVMIFKAREMKETE